MKIMTEEKNPKNDDPGDDMNNAADGSACLDYRKPKLITNADFVLLLLLLKSSSCAPSYTDCKED